MDRIAMLDRADARFNPGDGDGLKLKGVYKAKFFDKDGKLVWEDTADNLITTLGKNAILDAALAGSGYSATGPFMGLISSVGYAGAPAVGDQMTSHSNWAECDTSTHTPNIAARLTTNGGWSAASGGVKALSGTVNFSIITAGGTCKGLFLVFGTGAVATIGSTAGTLLSAALFSGGDQVCSVGGTLQVSYSLTLS